MTVLDGIRVPRVGSGRPRTRPDRVLADLSESPLRLYSPMVAAPGSGDGHHVQIWDVFRLKGALLGRYVPELWAADGAVTQRVPVVLDIRSRC